MFDRCSCSLGFIYKQGLEIGIIFKASVYDYIIWIVQAETHLCLNPKGSLVDIGLNTYQISWHREQISQICCIL